MIQLSNRHANRICYFLVTIFTGIFFELLEYSSLCLGLRQFFDNTNLCPFPPFPDFPDKSLDLSLACALMKVRYKTISVSERKISDFTKSVPEFLFCVLFCHDFNQVLGCNCRRSSLLQLWEIRCC